MIEKEGMLERERGGGREGRERERRHNSEAALWE